MWLVLKFGPTEWDSFNVSVDKLVLPIYVHDAVCTVITACLVTSRQATPISVVCTCIDLALVSQSASLTHEGFN